MKYLNAIIKKELKEIYINYGFDIDKNIISYIKVKEEYEKHTFYVGVTDYNFNFNDLIDLLDFIIQDLKINYDIKIKINYKFIIESV